MSDKPATRVVRLTILSEVETEVTYDLPEAEYRDWLAGDHHNAASVREFIESDGNEQATLAGLVAKGTPSRLGYHRIQCVEIP